ncbi:hypothetical protein JR316_0005653 [Psilocybe cubensis]|uniref:Uncharacterized protein n=2 Tax=Psilocybe cubensis TaxID=181762 RepID=A0ACB8GZR2_PSICU|nr:hypothetical protein JR316_0005653 [Psilocybe cubensis]KAH9481133.1 hypothetical protein JR316_0005653 [Psilocybe cubensis]
MARTNKASHTSSPRVSISDATSSPSPGGRARRKPKSPTKDKRVSFQRHATPQTPIPRVFISRASTSPHPASPAGMFEATETQLADDECSQYVSVHYEESQVVEDHNDAHNAAQVVEEGGSVTEDSMDNHSDKPARGGGPVTAEALALHEEILWRIPAGRFVMDREDQLERRIQSVQNSVKEMEASVSALERMVSATKSSINDVFSRWQDEKMDWGRVRERLAKSVDQKDSLEKTLAAVCQERDTLQAERLEWTRQRDEFIKVVDAIKQSVSQ